MKHQITAEELRLIKKYLIKQFPGLCKERLEVSFEDGRVFYGRDDEIGHEFRTIQFRMEKHKVTSPIDEAIRNLEAAESIRRANMQEQEHSDGSSPLNPNQ